MSKWKRDNYFFFNNNNNNNNNNNGKLKISLALFADVIKNALQRFFM